MKGKSINIFNFGPWQILDCCFGKFNAAIMDCAKLIVAYIAERVERESPDAPEEQACFLGDPEAGEDVFEEERECDWCGDSYANHFAWFGTKCICNCDEGCREAFADEIWRFRDEILRFIQAAAEKRELERTETRRLLNVLRTALEKSL